MAESRSVGSGCTRIPWRKAAAGHPTPRCPARESVKDFAYHGGDDAHPRVPCASPTRTCRTGGHDAVGALLCERSAETRHLSLSPPSSAFHPCAHSLWKRLAWPRSSTFPQPGPTATPSIAWTQEIPLRDLAGKGLHSAWESECPGRKG